MPTNAEEIRAAVEQRFAQVARSPEQERTFPVGPASAKMLGYDPLVRAVGGDGELVRLDRFLPPAAAEVDVRRHVQQVAQRRVLLAEPSGRVVRLAGLRRRLHRVDVQVVREWVVGTERPHRFEGTNDLGRFGRGTAAEAKHSLHGVQRERRCLQRRQAPAHAGD